MKKVIVKKIDNFKALNLSAAQQKKVKGGTDSEGDIIIEDTVGS